MLLLLGCAWSSCALEAVQPELEGATEDEEEDVRPASAALYGSGWTYLGTCTKAQLPNAERALFNSTILPRLLQRGRVAVNAPSYAQCLDTIMRAGGIFMEYDGLMDTWGPYCPPGDTGCFANGLTDINKDLTSGLSLAARKRFYARRALVESQSPNSVEITCDPNTTAGGAGETWGEDRVTSEVFQFGYGKIREAVRRELHEGDREKIDYESELAALIWHEAMHYHGYVHCGEGSGQIPDADCQTLHGRQIPHIVAACLRDTALRPFDIAAAMGPGANSCRESSCPTGTLPAPTTFHGGSCTCVRDPVQPSTPTATRSWSFSGTSAAALVSDSFGESALMLVGGKFRRREGNSWIDEGSAPAGSEVYAGGDTLVRRLSSGTIQRRLANDVWRNVGTANPNSLIMDDYGTLYRRTSTTISRLKVGSTSWSNIGTTSQALFAGGDAFFATSASNGDIYRFTRADGSWERAGSPGAAFSVDAFGTLHGLTPDHAAVFHNRGDDVWENVGGAARAIDASVRLYAQDPSSNQVYRRYPDGSWHSVASCDFFTGGGKVFYCVNQGPSIQTIQSFEID